MRYRIDILADSTRKGHKYILIPFGMYCNRDIQKAKQGDEIDLQCGWERKRMILMHSCRIKVNSEIFTFMCKSLYRGFNTASALFANWEAQCISEGLGKHAFSHEEVILIEVKEITDGEKN